MDMKNKIKHSLVKLDDILVWTDDGQFSYGKETLPVYSWETIKRNWLRKFPNIFSITKVRDIYAHIFDTL